MTKILFVICTISIIPYFSNCHSIRSEHLNDDTVLRTYRRCMWESTKYLPRRLVLLSLCGNLFCENNMLATRTRSLFVLEKVPRTNDCLDVLLDNCEQDDEEKLWYRPFPECCPVFCELKKRLNRLKHLINRRRWTYSRTDYPDYPESQKIQHTDKHPSVSSDMEYRNQYSNQLTQSIQLSHQSQLPHQPNIYTNVFGHDSYNLNL